MFEIKDGKLVLDGLSQRILAEQTTPPAYGTSPGMDALPTDYEALTDDALQELSSWLYEEYLNGENYLDDLHRIADVLRSRASTVTNGERNDG